MSVCTFFPDGQRLLSGSADGTVKIWDASNGSELSTLHVRSAVDDAALSPNGSRLFTSSEGVLKLWDFAGSLPLLFKCGFKARLASGLPVVPKLSSEVISLEKHQGKRWSFRDKMICAPTDDTIDWIIKLL